MAPDEIAGGREVRGAGHIAIGSGVPQMAGTSPLLIPLGLKVAVEEYGELIGNPYFPQMAATAFPKVKGDLLAFRLDNAAARTAKPVMDSIRQNTPGAFYPWPSRSPDLNILDYFTWNAVKQFLESMDPPAQGSGAPRCHFSGSCHHSTEPNRCCHRPISRSLRGVFESGGSAV